MRARVKFWIGVKVDIRPSRKKHYIKECTSDGDMDNNGVHLAFSFALSLKSEENLLALNSGRGGMHSHEASMFLFY